MIGLGIFLSSQYTDVSLRVGMAINHSASKALHVDSYKKDWSVVFFHFKLESLQSICKVTETGNQVHIDKLSAVLRPGLETPAQYFPSGPMHEPDT